MMNNDKSVNNISTSNLNTGYPNMYHAGETIF